MSVSVIVFTIDFQRILLSQPKLVSRLCTGRDDGWLWFMYGFVAFCICVSSVLSLGCYIAWLVHLIFCCTVAEGLKNSHSIFT